MKFSDVVAASCRQLSEVVRWGLGDEKGLVRKAGVAAAEELVTVTGVSVDDVRALAMCCSDSLLSVRKAALGALTKVRG